ncbi:outer membrane receptor for ferrienterochelin and colicins [Massilia sp. UYP11]|uniref:TonB-dependent receptor domain-containing protein n=1 Tax=Massilia sp. UYP11 TaxID=1756385 RepID=UPI003D255820
MPTPVLHAPLLRRSLLSLAIGALPVAAHADAVPADMATVVVSASGFEQTIREAPASITVLTRDQLEKERFGNLAQALESVEGIDVAAAGDKTGGMNISVRGMPSDYTLLLIDGRRQNAAGNVTPNGFGGTSTSFMPPVSAIERIEIIRGPMSTLYGSDAMGGVVNIITRKVGKQWNGSVSADYTVQEESAFGDVKAGKFYLSGPIASEVLGLALRGSAQRRDAASITYEGQTNGLNMGANPVESTVRNLGARLAFTPHRNHEVTLDADATRQKYDNSTGLLGTLGVQGGYGPEQQYNRNQYTAAYKARLPFGTWDSSYMVNQTETNGRTIPPGTPGAAAGSPRTLEVESKVFDTKLLVPWGNHLTTIGAQHWDAEMVDGVAPEVFAFTQKALFLEDEWRLHERLALTLGARYDDHSIFGGQTSPRAYLVWTTSPRWTFKGGVSKGYKTPRVEQLSPGIIGFGGQGTIPLVGSPGLTPETSVTTELGAYFDNGAGWTGNVTVFNNEFQDKITSGTGLLNCAYRLAPDRPGCVSFGNWPNVDAFSQSINVDEAVTRGVELATRFPLAAGWVASANYTYTESEQKSGANAGKPLSDTPEHALNARLTWDISQQWNAWLRAEYRSERYRDPGVSAVTRAAKATLGDYKGYGMLHLGTAYQLSPTISINAAIYNLLNKDFVDYRPYQSTPTAAPTYGSVYVNNMDGRRLWVSMNVDF